MQENDISEVENLLRLSECQKTSSTKSKGFSCVREGSVGRRFMFFAIKTGKFSPRPHQSGGGYIRGRICPKRPLCRFLWLLSCSAQESNPPEARFSTPPYHRRLQLQLRGIVNPFEQNQSFCLPLDFGVIATGNHRILDSLRASHSDTGEALLRCRAFVFCN